MGTIMKFTKMLGSNGVPPVWGTAIKNQIDTLINMNNEKTRRSVDRSSVDAAKYPAFSKACERPRLLKPLQVGTVWPALVNGKLVLVVPDGGKCGVCGTDLSNSIAHYDSTAGEGDATIPKDVAAVVTRDVNKNVKLTR